MTAVQHGHLYCDCDFDQDCDLQMIACPETGSLNSVDGGILWNGADFAPPA